MPDIVDAATRSRMMSGIKGRNTQPELVLRKQLHRDGFRYRLHVKNLPGKPDIVLRRHEAVVLVHGCFWHRHTGCKFATSPGSNMQFWSAKFSGTIERDRRNVEDLRRLGWRVAVVWECQLDKPHAPDTFAALASWLRSGDVLFELPPSPSSQEPPP